MKQELMVTYGEVGYRGWFHETFTLNVFVGLIRLRIGFIEAYLYLCCTFLYLYHIKIIKDLGKGASGLQVV